MDKRKKRILAYETIMALLALAVVVMTIIKMSDLLSPANRIKVDKAYTVIWFIFVIDYFTRLFRSPNKWNYIKTHKIDLLVIIPFDELFVGFRLLKLTQFLIILRSFFFLRVFNQRAKYFLKTHHFNYILLAAVFIIVFGAVSISFVENWSFSDSLWWSFVTATTVGYGDLSPVTNLGRIIAVLLMLVGIGFIGTLTGTIATFLLSNRDKDMTYKQQVIKHSQEQLDRFDELTEEDLNTLFRVLSTLKEESHLHKNE